MLLKGGKLYYDTPIGILCLESRFPKPRGHVRNPLTYDFPTVQRLIRGVDIPRLLFNPSDDLLEPFVQAAQELEADGVQAITGSCGFMARFQDRIAAQVRVPVLLSSLVQLPLVRLMHGARARDRRAHGQRRCAHAGSLPRLRHAHEQRAYHGHGKPKGIPGMHSGRQTR